MKAYIDIETPFLSSKRFELKPFDLWVIGDFTRDNLVNWLNKGQGLNGYTGIYGWETFHAVCGDKEVRSISEK